MHLKKGRALFLTVASRTRMAASPSLRAICTGTRRRVGSLSATTLSTLQSCSHLKPRLSSTRMPGKTRCSSHRKNQKRRCSCTWRTKQFTLAITQPRSIQSASSFLRPLLYATQPRSAAAAVISFALFCFVLFCFVGRFIRSF